jgi:hypothetical protein
MRFRTVAAAALSVPLALAASAVPPAGASPAVRSTAPFSEAKAADVIILADESGSMSSPSSHGELPGEQQAAAEIANAAWSKDSRVAIYGFGSAPPGQPEATAVNKICGLTPVATQTDIATLDGCASRIAVRPSNASNTDFGEALTVAGQVLTAQGPAAQGRVPLVFMLTDGKLDLGSTAATTAAQQELSGVILPGLASQHIEIWPVGFGAADNDALDAIAAGGAQANQSCPAGIGGAPRATPVATTGTSAVETTEQIQGQLLQAFATASCATAGPGQWRVLAPGKSVTLDAAVDPLTTLGSIVVNKGSPAVSVTYTDPDGGHVSDASAASPASRLNAAAYELSSSGPAATQEALRLDYPAPGRWAVTFRNPTGQPQLVGTQVLWQGQIVPDISFSPTTGASGKRLQVLVKPALTARPIPAKDLTRLRVAVTVQWSGDGPAMTVPVTFDVTDGLFTGPVQVPAGQQGTAQVKATVQADGVTGAASASLAYQPGGGLGVTVTIPPGTRVDPGATLTASAAVTNLDNTRQPVTSIRFLLSGLTGTGTAIINQAAVRVGSGTGSVPVIIHVGTARGQVQGVIEWEVDGTTVQHPAGFLDITVEPPPPWYTQWWPWTALAVVVLAGAGLYTRRRVTAGRAQRDRAKTERAEAERRAANSNVCAAGLALLRRDVPGDSEFLRWTDGGEAHVFERWFDVRRTTGGIPRLLETTHKKSGRFLRLTRGAENGTFRLTAPGVPALAPPDATGNGTAAGAADDAATAAPGTAAAADSPAIREDRPFDPPPGTGLDDCVFMVTLGDARRAKLPDPRLDDPEDEDYVPVAVSTGPSWRDQEFERPDPTEYDDFSDFDEHGDAGGSGA